MSGAGENELSTLTTLVDGLERLHKTVTLALEMNKGRPENSKENKKNIRKRLPF